MLYSKTIGKSKYTIDHNVENDHFRIYEIFDGAQLAFDPRKFKTMSEAENVLRHISRERVYTDPYKPKSIKELSAFVAAIRLYIKKNQALYTKEKDGTIQKWYLWAWIGNQICVSSERNLRAAYKRYYDMNEIGESIFLTRKEAITAEVQQ